MGHGKETPRQKMIGMMYLVLTAMLALNVSAQVLDAFRLVDEGLKTTTENYTKKNEVLYDQFATKFAENEEKVGPYKEAADEVREKSEALYQYIQDLKLEIVKVNQGQNEEENAAIEDGKIINEKLKGTDKEDIATRILIGENYNGKGYDLKNMINEYREMLLSIVDEDNVRVRNSLKNNLNTDDPEPSDTDHSEQTSWEIKHFSHIPLGAIMPILSKFQVDVRNSESEVVQYLLNQIDAGSFAFNKLEVAVIPNSSYIIEGNPYKADVFLAAVDTTAPPKVYVGQYDSTQNEDGTWDYEMIGNYDSLDVVNGKGKFEVQQRIGQHTWGGIIQLMGPDGNLITKTFKRSYQVAKPNVVVSATKMNVFYVGVDNPVSVSVAGVATDKIHPSITNGRIRRQGDGNYIVNPRRPGNSIVTVNAEVEGNMTSIGTQQFRVKSLPDPVAKVAGKKGGDIQKNVLLAQQVVAADMENFDFDLTFNITSYTISTTDQGGYFIEEPIEGSRITDRAKDMIDQARRNQKINFEDIRAIGPDGVERKLAAIVFTVK
ncbi:MAG: gliding motility protein GldM [Bacteroidota bacterium]